MRLPPAIQQVMRVFQKHQVQALLMGGQACIVYGAAEFSRDIDLAILSSPENWGTLQNALAELQAEVIAVPPAKREFLEAGLAVHFRCHAPGVQELRLDIMSHMRGVDAFPALWSRRHQTADGFHIMALPDLVQAKKTQRDKDWPMIRRLIEADTILHPAPTKEKLHFWLKECRTPEILLHLAQEHLEHGQSHPRPAVTAALRGADAEAIFALLRQEEDTERKADAAWWAPLRKKLEALRRERHTDS